MSSTKLPDNLMTFDRAWALAKVPLKLPSEPTRIRWATSGMHGVVLETMNIGGRVLTRPEWIAEFFVKLTLAKRKASQQRQKSK